MSWNADTWLHIFDMSQTKLAEMIGYDSSQIRSWKRQDREPNGKHYSVLAAALLAEKYDIGEDEVSRWETMARSRSEAEFTRLKTAVEAEVRNLRLRFATFSLLKKLAAHCGEIVPDAVPVEPAKLNEAPFDSLLEEAALQQKCFVLALCQLSDSHALDMKPATDWKILQSTVDLPVFSDLKKVVSALAGLQRENVKNLEDTEKHCADLRVAIGNIETCSPDLDEVVKEIDELIGNVDLDSSRRYLMFADYLGNDTPGYDGLRQVQSTILHAINTAPVENTARVCGALERLAESIVLFLLSDDDIDADFLSNNQLIEVNCNKGVFVRGIIDSALTGVDRLTHVHERDGELKLDPRFTHELPPGRSTNPAQRVQTVVEELARGTTLEKSYKPPTLANGDDLQAFSKCSNTRQLNREFNWKKNSSDHNCVISPVREGSEFQEALGIAGLKALRVVNQKQPECNQAFSELDDRDGYLELFILEIKQLSREKKDQQRVLERTREHAPDLIEIVQLFKEFSQLSNDASQLAPALAAPVEQIQQDLAEGKTPDKETANTLRKNIEAAGTAMTKADKAVSITSRFYDLGYKVADKIDQFWNLGG